MEAPKCLIMSALGAVETGAQAGSVKKPVLLTENQRCPTLGLKKFILCGLYAHRIASDGMSSGRLKSLSRACALRNTRLQARIRLAIYSVRRKKFSCSTQLTVNQLSETNFSSPSSVISISHGSVGTAPLLPIRCSLKRASVGVSGFFRADGTSFRISPNATIPQFS